MKTELTDTTRDKPYLFFRDSGFCPVLLRDDFDAVENAKCNPGTLKVMDAVTESIVWEATP